MNSSNFMHAVYAVMMQAVVAFLLFAAHESGIEPTPIVWCALAGACAGAFFFLGREHGLQERKLGGPLITYWWEGFTGWGRDQYLDVLFPVLACIAVTVAVRFV